MTHDEMLRFLFERSVLRAMPPDALRALAYVMRRVVLDDGERVFDEGDAGAEAYVVLDGAVEIGTTIGGAWSLRTTLGPGELFGELALFGAGRRAASARAKGATVLGMVEHDRLSSVIRAWPEAALALLRLQAERFLAIERELRASKTARDP
ncbi:MAG: cyclic nucleotide-binding domain-containing protein [Deltaproteobacteria bacterium]|nr:cyclic nucleotide-binding domain-containing protein [Deltaproteobacteria bacterium]